MQYARLGTSHLEVSRIGMGTGGWMWDGMDESEATYALHRAVDLGINLIDTAPCTGSAGRRKSSEKPSRNPAAETGW